MGNIVGVLFFVFDRAMLSAVSALFYRKSGRTFYAMSRNNCNIAVVLSGCGVYDGSEIHEASATLVHLSRNGAVSSMFAPNINQMHVIDHTKGEPMNETRNVLVESARIARGKIQSLDLLEAKNLSTFAVDGTSCSVNDDVSRVLKAFHSEHKPIGLCCISPVLAAKVISGCEVTVGADTDEDGKWPYAGTAGAITSLGANHINKNVTEIHTDEANKIVTTPAFMCETAVHEIYDGIGEMVNKVVKMVST